MGSGAVADSGPLIHLSEIGRIGLLAVFEALHVPDAVWAETVGKGRIAPLALASLRRHAVSQEASQRLAQDRRLRGLHAGEIECLFLCSRLGVVTLLTDDLAVRDAAKRLGVRPVGSLGVIVRGWREGRLTRTEAEELLVVLDESSTLFATRAIIELAREQLREGEH